MWILVVLGLVAGVLGGLLGIGGGALIVPGLVFFLGVGQHKAHGTSLAAALMLGISGLITYSLHGNIDLLLAVEIAGGGVIGAVLGARVVSKIRATMLRRIFSLFLVLVGMSMVLKGAGMGDGLGGHAQSTLVDGGPAWILITLGTGIATGFVSALLGIGGGLVMVPAMVFLLGIPQKMAQGVSLAAIIPTALTGVLMHRVLGNVDLRLAKWLAMGAVVGAFAGGTIASHLETGVLKIVFGSFLLVMSVLMALKKNGR